MRTAPRSLVRRPTYVFIFNTSMPLTAFVGFAESVTRRANRAATAPHLLAAVVGLSARTCRGSIGSTALTSRAVTKSNGVPPGHPGAEQIAGSLETGKSGKSEQNRPPVKYCEVGHSGQKISHVGCRALKRQN